MDEHTEAEKLVYNKAIEDAANTLNRYLEHACKKADSKHVEVISSWMTGTKGAIRQLKLK